MMRNNLPASGRGMSLDIDTREFSAALRQLASMSKRGVADAINDNMADLFLTASANAPAASKQSIRDLTSKPWWPAFVTKVINREGGFDLKFRRKAKQPKDRNVQWVDTPTGRVMRGRDTMTVYRKARIKKRALRSLFSGRVHGVSDADAKRVSAAIIRRRVATVNAAKATLGWVATKFAPWKVRKFFRKNLKFARIHPATVSAAFAEAVVPYDNKRKAWVNSSKATTGRPSPERDVEHKAAVGHAALMKALPIVTKRMRDAIEKKMARAMQQASARAA